MLKFAFRLFQKKRRENEMRKNRPNCKFKLRLFPFCSIFESREKEKGSKNDLYSTHFLLSPLLFFW